MSKACGWSTISLTRTVSYDSVSVKERSKAVGAGEREVVEGEGVSGMGSADSSLSLAAGESGRELGRNRGDGEEEDEE